jgi:hypothetical protein
MAQPPSSLEQLEQLYRDLHQVEAEILACRPGRIGTRWWDARVANRQRLRSEIDGAVQRLGASAHDTGALLAALQRHLIAASAILDLMSRSERCN